MCFHEHLLSNNCVPCAQAGFPMAFHELNVSETQAAMCLLVSESAKHTEERQEAAREKQACKSSSRASETSV